MEHAPRDSERPTDHGGVDDDGGLRAACADVTRFDTRRLLTGLALMAAGTGLIVGGAFALGNAPSFAEGPAGGAFLFGAGAGLVSDGLSVGIGAFMYSRRHAALRGMCEEYRTGRRYNQDVLSRLMLRVAVDNEMPTVIYAFVSGHLIGALGSGVTAPLAGSWMLVGGAVTLPVGALLPVLIPSHVVQAAQRYQRGEYLRSARLRAASPARLALPAALALGRARW